MIQFDSVVVKRDLEELRWWVGRTLSHKKAEDLQVRHACLCDEVVHRRSFALNATVAD
jgi:hypothetical protein